jgi:hypothetical protein
VVDSRRSRWAKLAGGFGGKELLLAEVRVAVEVGFSPFRVVNVPFLVEMSGALGTRFTSHQKSKREVEKKHRAKSLSGSRAKVLNLQGI